VVAVDAYLQFSEVLPDHVTRHSQSKTAFVISLKMLKCVTAHKGLGQDISQSAAVR
jgi:hypothetical protein